MALLIIEFDSSDPARDAEINSIVVNGSRVSSGSEDNMGRAQNSVR